MIHLYLLMMVRPVKILKKGLCMPFKPGKSPDDVNRAVTDEINQIVGVKLERALAVTATAIGNAADNYVPIDTYDLIQSRRITGKPLSNGYGFTIGYYEPYAVYLYDDATWRPRSAGSPGKRGAGTNPNAKSRWIDKGVNDIDMQSILTEAMRK